MASKADEFRKKAEEYRDLAESEASLYAPRSQATHGALPVQPAARAGW